MSTGWDTRSEVGICLTCHRSIEIKWRVAPDGSKVDPVAPAHKVAAEQDERDPRVTWVTLQQKCRCGSFLGIVVDVVAPAAEELPAATAKAQ
jgi:hypothetical protein